MKYLAVAPHLFGFGATKSKAKKDLRRGAIEPLEDSIIGIYQVPDDYTIGDNRWGEGSTHALHIEGPDYVIERQDA